MQKISKSKIEAVYQNLQIILIIWHINVKPEKILRYSNLEIKLYINHTI
jgi:hypothetical protein